MDITDELKVAHLLQADATTDVDEKVKTLA
jgi:hypothetical protein